MTASNYTNQTPDPNVFVDRGKRGLRDRTYEPKRPRYDITTRNASQSGPGIFYGATNI